MSEPLHNPFVHLRGKAVLELAATDRFAAAGHWWSQPEIDALILAWAARRPLLVRGEAGSGKSQIARAAAACESLGPLLVEVIHPRFEALDLLYQVDVVARLADAQVENALDRTNVKYVKHGRLWQAMDKTAPDKPTPVLLIDEIDKADADVPNALLDVLGNRSFTVPPLEDKTISAEGGRLPLVVITTNEERELPAAFVRRCVVLNLKPPENPNEFIDWLIERGGVHRHLDVENEACNEAARQVYQDRVDAVRQGYPPVGLAEYIDLLTALHELTRGVPPANRAAKQLEWLRRIGVYALVKNAGQRQTRSRRDNGEPPSASEADEGE